MTRLFCERKAAPRSAFDPRSFRWVKRGKAKILVGCPRGKWDPKAERCKVGTRAYAVLSPAKAGACPAGKRPVKKGGRLGQVAAPVGDVADVDGGKESLRVMPKTWWQKRAPKADRICYSSKTAALNKFREHNQAVIDAWGGETAKGSRGEFDALSKWGATPTTIAEAIWLALPPERVNYGKGPFCLTEIDVEALNDTAPGRNHPVGFQLPDFVHEAEGRREEEAWYRAQEERERAA